MYLPKMLYGNGDDAKAAWASLLNTAIKDFAGFLARFDSLEVVEVTGDRGKFILRDDLDRPTKNDESHWRLNVVSETFVKWWKGMERFDTSIRAGPFEIIADFDSVQTAATLQQQIIIHGIDRFWFVLAMLHPDPNGPGFLSPGDRARELFYLPLLRAFVHWLPEIEALMPRLYYGLGTWLMPYQDAANRHLWWYIWAEVLKLVEVFRPSVPFDDMRKYRIPYIYQGNVIEALLGENVIQRLGERYTLNEVGGWPGGSL